MNTLKIIYKGTSQKLLKFKSVVDYTSSYQTVFDKVASLLADFSSYTQSSIEAYFQTTMLMNIRSKYLALVSLIQKK